MAKIRISGIVKSTNFVKNMLQIGIKADELTNFQLYLQNQIKTIEKLCSEAGTNPDYLPTPSRNAYYFLKQVDLENLPILAGDSYHPQIQAENTKIQLKNILNQQNFIQQKIDSLTINKIPPQNELINIQTLLEENVNTIEAICHHKQLNPSHLSDSSFKIYAWLKFLTNRDFLKQHLLTTFKTKAIAEKIANKKLINPENIKIKFNNIKALYRGKKNKEIYNLTINEGFIFAPENVIEAILRIIFKDKNKDLKLIINQYVNSSLYKNILANLELSKEFEIDNYKGQYYNLEQLFQKINQQYFASSLEKPRLNWSKSLTKRKFGHYEFARDQVVISLTLDNQNVPSFVVEFVLYHELLHKYCGQKIVNGKTMVHTAEFKQLEQKFAFYEEAEAYLQKLTHLAKF